MPTLKLGKSRGVDLLEQLDALAGDTPPTGSANFHQPILEQEYLAVLLETLPTHASDGAKLCEARSIALADSFKHTQFNGRDAHRQNVKSRAHVFPILCSKLRTVSMHIVDNAGGGIERLLSPPDEHCHAAR